MVEKSTLLAITFFDETSTGKNSRLFLVKLQAKDKYPWYSLFRLKYESYNLQHYKKELPQVNFLRIYRTTTLPHNF